jgi:uncharacterized protein YdaU (DUF1376 family)
MHYYKRNLGDYAKKAGRLTMLQHGAYTLLLDACYDREQFPTLEEAIVWTWASTREEKEAVEFVLERFFDLEEGRYVQNRIREELAKYRENSDTNKRIAMEREAKRREKSTKRAQVVDEPPPNQEPRTNNQDTETNVSVAKSTSPDCPHDQILALWAEVLPSAIQPREWTSSRQTALRARWREKAKRQDLGWWRKLFEYVGESDFLMGKTSTPGRRPFELSLDWVLKQENLVKIIEGFYHSKEAA